VYRNNTDKKKRSRSGMRSGRQSLAAAEKSVYIQYRVLFYIKYHRNTIFSIEKSLRYAIVYLIEISKK
jgi:hypothetical protein